jgi:3-oxoacyl-[acyl-carrier-protein] synthase-1
MTAPATGAAAAVVAVGATSPLGFTWRQTCASVRAGLNRFGSHPWYEALTPDPEWDEADPLRCSMMPGWEEALDAPERLPELALEALRDVLAQVPLRRAELGTGAIALALPGGADLSGGAEAAQGILDGIVARAGLDGFARVEARSGGPDAFFAALGEAAERIRRGELAFCLVGAADTYLLDDRLDGLDGAWRLRSRRNPDGFIPGEAAVMLLLASPRFLSAAGLAPLCTVGAPALAREPETIAGDRASSGAGLAQAIAKATGGAPAPPWVLCDLNGESYRAFEWGLVQARLAPRLDPVRRVQHPADCLGDVGAATGALLVACAAHAFARNAAPASSALVWASGDDGARVATIVAAPPAARR